MLNFVMPLPLDLDVSSLTMALVNIASPRGSATALADSVQAALLTRPQLQVDRAGDTVVARTDAGHHGRIVVVARLETAPGEPDPLAYVEMGKLFGPGASDAKGALAVILKAGAACDSFKRDATFVFCADGDDVPGILGLRDDVQSADLVLMAEPTACTVRGDALDHPLAVELAGLAGADAVPGLSEHGLPHCMVGDVPAVAFGPGDPSVAGRPDEYVPTAELTQCEWVLRQWLTAQPD